MSGIRWWLLGVLVWCAGVLAMNSIAEVPWWDADPLLSDLPETSLTPGQVLIICALGLLASTGLLVESVRRGEMSRRSVVVLGSIAIGGLGVILHGLVLGPIAAGGAAAPVRGDMESLVTGATWVGGLFGGFAVAVLKPRDRVLRLVLGVFIVLGTLMVAKALFEKFIELPRTIALFERERDGVLLANGIEPGSARADIYEHRLRSQQPTAWFGLANVLASFLGAMLVLLVASSVRAVRDTRAGSCSSGASGLVGLLALCTATALWLTGALGAIGAVLLVGVAAAAVLRSERIKALVGKHPGRAIACAGFIVLLGIVVRGLLLPESVDRSVLFRWHYLIGTFRVWMEHLLLGAGPGGFQDAYTRLKPPISPENVQSPHVLIADWVGAFGLLGVAVVGGLLFWFWHAKAVSSSTETEPSPTGVRGEFAWCLLVGAVVLITSLGVQWGVVGGVADLLLVLALGLGVGGAALGVLLGIWRRHPGSLAWGAIGMASVLIGHAMFDVAPARASSAMLFWLLVGVGVGPMRGAAVAGRCWLALPLVAGLGLAGVLGAAGVRQVCLVEPLLAEAARTARARAGEFATPALPEGWSGRSPASGIIDLLDPASKSSPGWLKLDVARFRFASRTAALGSGLVELGSEADRLGERWTNSVEAQSAIGAGMWSFRGSPAYGPEFIARAADASERAAGLAPHDAQPAYRAAIVLREAGRGREASAWAARAVANIRQEAMDPLAGLAEEQLLRLRRGFPWLFSDRADAEGGDGLGG